MGIEERARHKCADCGFGVESCEQCFNLMTNTPFSSSEECNEWKNYLPSPLCVPFLFKTYWKMRKIRKDLML